MVCKWFGKWGLECFEEPCIKYPVCLVLRIKCLRLLSNIANKLSRRFLKVSICPNKACYAADPVPKAVRARDKHCMCLATLSWGGIPTGLLKSWLAKTAMLCLAWRSPLFLPQGVQICISHFKDQAAKEEVEDVGQEWSSLSSVGVSVQRELQFYCIYTDHLQDKMSEQEFINKLRVGDKVYLSSILYPSETQLAKSWHFSF